MYPLKYGQLQEEVGWICLCKRNFLDGSASRNSTALLNLSRLATIFIIAIVIKDMSLPTVKGKEDSLEALMTDTSIFLVRGLHILLTKCSV